MQGKAREGGRSKPTPTEQATSPRAKIPSLNLQLEEIGEKFLAVSRQDRLRMELDAPDG